MNLPIKARLTVWYVFLFALIVGAWSLFVVGIVRSDLYTDIDRALALRASQISVGLQGPGEGEFQDITNTTLARVPKEEAAAQLLSASGVVLESSGDVISEGPMVPQATLRDMANSGGAVTVHSSAAGESFRVLVAKVPSSSRYIVVGQSTETTDATMRRLVLVMLFTGPLALLAAALGGWFVARRGLRPVEQMATAAADIGIDRLGDRVPQPAGKDELAVLAATLNGMLARLQTDVEDKRRFVNDASHELQTPLAVMRAELDVSLATPGLSPEVVEVLESTREEADRMSRIVRNLLALGRFDEGTLRLLRTRTDLAEVVSKATASLETLAHERGVAVDIETTPSILDGDAEYLGLVAVNLIENAIKYSEHGGHVMVRTEPGAGRVSLVVSDDGVGIPQSAIPHLFDRFYRVDRPDTTDSAGSGLGLSISNEIVHAHGGSIDVSSTVGRGSRFTVTLPRA